jgi:hypothetical protein
LDENLCTCQDILAVLSAEQCPFRLHLDIFERGTLDEVWLPVPGLLCWPVLTKDKAQRYSPLEKSRLTSYGLRVFAFSSGNLSGAEMAALLKSNLRRIDKLSRKQPPPFLASITQTGIHLRLLK